MTAADELSLSGWLPLDGVFVHVRERFASWVPARHVIRQALAGGQVASLMWSFERGANSNNKKLELPASFWQSAKFKIFQGAPNELYVQSTELQRNSYHYSFFLRQSDVERLWPEGSKPVAATDETAQVSAPWRRASRAGAKGDYDWEKILIEAAGFMYENGVPKSFAQLCRHIENWCGADAPGDTQLTAHLRPLYERFKKTDGK